MSEQSRPLLHLARGIEELLLASADALASWRARLEEKGPSPIERSIEGLARTWSAFTPAELTETLALLRQALREEHARWEGRARNDPAARRLRDLCAALLDLMGEEGYGEGANSAPLHRAPRRRRA